jgi:GntR family transcriptional regulator, arabinose operon transcriptional repressor
MFADMADNCAVSAGPSLSLWSSILMADGPSSLTTLPNLGSRSRRKHERIYDALMFEVTSGRLRVGDALPTENQLAEMMNVSRSTIRQTLRDMENEGVVRRERGKGTFVIGNGSVSQSAQIRAFAIVLPDTRIGYMPSLQRGFGGECYRHQRHMVVYDTDQDIYKQSDAILRLLDQKVAGVAIVPPTTAETPPHHIRPLQDQGIPVVFCHRRVAGVKAPLITFSGLEVGRAAGRALGERGHRTVAYFGAASEELANQYAVGLREAITEFGGSLPDEYLFFGKHTHGPVPEESERAFEEKLREIMSSRTPPTAVMVSFDTTAESLYLGMARLGIRVPEDISLVSFGGTWYESAITGRLAAVTVDEANLGCHAARLLYEMASGKRSLDNDEEILLPLGLRVGQTLREIA